MEAFPAYFPLRGRRVVIAGDGDGAEAKARLFAGSPADVVRIGRTEALRPASYAGADLIFLASYDADFVREAAQAARTAGAPINVVDHPELSDFHTPAIVDRGQVVAAVGSAGAAPLLASLLRAEIELRAPAAAGRIAALLGSRRDSLRAAYPDLPQRRAFLRRALTGPAAAAAESGDIARAGAALDEAILDGPKGAGRVSFIEIPSAPDLLSVRAVRALNTADIVVVAGNGAETILASHVRRDAEQLGPEAADETVLLSHGLAGRLVAVLGRARRDGLEARLADHGVTVERLAPAPSA
jgi:precorrin-2 dehydrogenase/sirohydrochlorin ferrochelatase